MSALAKTIFLFCAFVFLCAATPPDKVTHYEGHPKTPAKAYKEKVLNFYSTHEPYGEFSNFARFPVFIDDKWWATSEHYYQAMKYEKADLQEWVRKAESPKEAAARGRDPKIPKRPDWEQVKETYMEKALMDKFTRHSDLKELLLLTGDAKLYEHTENDCYWGDCGDKTGKNRLGFLLEKVRDSLKKAK